MEEGDLIISIQAQLVTQMAHGEVVNFIKNITGDSMEMSVERGEIVVPNITDCFPLKSEADLARMTEEERRLYWQEAMKAGLGSRLGPKHFTTVGKMKVSLVRLVGQWVCSLFYVLLSLLSRPVMSGLERENEREVITEVCFYVETLKASVRSYYTSDPSCLVTRLAQTCRNVVIIRGRVSDGSLILSLPVSDIIKSD